jgi:chromosome segregation ATPase
VAASRDARFLRAFTLARGSHWLGAWRELEWQGAMADENPTLLDVWRLLQGMSRKLDEHTHKHDEHTRKLDEHTRKLDEHTHKHDEHTRSIQDIWSLLGRMNRRMDGFDERFDAFERKFIASNDRVGAQMASLDARVMTAIGALKESIENRDFRLDEHGRRLSKLEASQP